MNNLNILAYISLLLCTVGAARWCILEHIGHAAREYRLETSQLHITRSLFTALLYYTYKDIWIIEYSIGASATARDLCRFLSISAAAAYHHYLNIIQEKNKSQQVVYSCCRENCRRSTLKNIYIYIFFKLIYDMSL